jgi:hypothetical protein
MKLLFITAILLLGTIIFAQDVNGIWVGQYKYNESDENGKNMFTFLLHSDGNVVTGKVLENNTFGYQTWHMLSSDFIGEIEGDKIKIFKKYDGSGLQNHVVVYKGKITGSKIKGEWNTGGNNGPFEMVKIESDIFEKKLNAETSKF